jgi:nicotinamidase-related amidase
MLTFNLRSQELVTDAQGHNEWGTVITQKPIDPARIAIIICDMWDNHWSRGAVERVNHMVPRMNVTLNQARESGIHIIHAPSDVIDFYGDHPARQRIVDLKPINPPELLEHADPPLPIDDTDGGSDTGETESHHAWARQHSGLDIDPDRDVISANGNEIYAYLQSHAIQQVALMGMHTNMCVLNRSFAIKQMVRWGVSIALVRDLTDTMYNPARSPYVSHDEGTQLVIAYIEKFWCPSIISGDLIKTRKD